jgi:asparagine synthase (glutamine-hydrolysing)
VALTGDGGDECFAGYDRYRAARLAAGLDWIPGRLRRFLAAGASCLPHRQPRTHSNRLYRFLTAVADSPALRYLSWVSIFPPPMLAAGYRDEFRATLDWDEPVTWFERLYASADGPAANRAVRTDLASYLPYDLLTKVDIASMACSLECRCPMLDHELVAFALSLPLTWRLGRRGGKHILKDWARDRLPPETLHRRKMGFGVPVGEWFRGELQDLVRQHVLSPHGLCARVFRPPWLQALVNAHLSGRANYQHQLWALLTLELWQQRWQPAFR